MRNILAPDRLLLVVHVPALASHADEADLNYFASLTDEQIATMARNSKFISTHQGGALDRDIWDRDNLMTTAVFVSNVPDEVEQAATRYLLAESARARLVLKGRLIDDVAAVIETL